LDRDAEHQEFVLKRALGFPPEAKIQLRKDVSLPTEFVPRDADISTDLEKHRLDLLALKQGYESQEQTLVAATLSQFPRINLGFTRAVDNTKVRSIGLGVSIDVPIFDRNQGNIATEKATRQKLFDEYLSRVFDAHADIAMALADIKAINQQIKDAQDAIPNLQKLVDVYKVAVDHGNADVLSYYLAWNNLAQKNLDLLKLQQQLADNRIALEIATGRYFPDETP
jgi:cobalt-zinc-cadmium efflux system outer membrane protein